MCGRFTLLARLAALQDRFKISEISEDYKPQFNQYNIAPTQAIPAVHRRNKGNFLFSMKWGMKVGQHESVINTRADRIDVVKTYSKLFSTNRCLIPASGFYEWKTIGNKKVPYYFKLKSTELFAFAGLYQFTSENDSRYKGAIITTSANEIVRKIHDRMPVIIPKSQEDFWLDPQSPTSKLLELLVPYPEADIEYYPVNPKVNSPKHNSPDLIKPKKGLTSFL